MFRVILMCAPCLLVLTACSHEPQTNPFTGFYKGYATCRTDIEALDARIAKARVGNAEYYRPPGFPYFRTDRVLASLSHELNSQDAIWEWTRRMRELDMEAREYELLGLNLDRDEYAVLHDRMSNCGRVLADVELRDEKNWKQLLKAVRPADDYSNFSRSIGLYSLLAPRKEARIEADLRTWTASYTAALPSTGDNGAALKTWKAKSGDKLELTAVPSLIEINVLGYPGLIGSGWRTLAQSYAPILWTETRGDFDGPAALQYAAQAHTPDAAPSKPVVYYQLGYTRFGGHTLIQVSYYVYFSTPEGAETAPVDGLVWRVTFDPTLRPLVYESMHGSGRDHRWYPIQPLATKVVAEGEEPQFIAPELAPESNAALRIASTTHAVTRVVTAAQATAESIDEYELRGYEELYTLTTADGKTRSAFDPDGMVWNAKGIDPNGGFSSGIRNAGAIRQAGHFPLAHIGKRHFDDHDILSAAFVAPQWPPAAPPADALISASAR